jgi:hypothetical protein
VISQVRNTQVAEQIGSRPSERIAGDVMGTEPVTAAASWQAFVPKILPFLVHQQSIFLLPAEFSPIK